LLLGRHSIGVVRMGQHRCDSDVAALVQLGWHGTVRLGWSITGTNRTVRHRRDSDGAAQVRFGRCSTVATRKTQHRSDPDEAA
jgi:hypothetical protein